MELPGFLSVFRQEAFCFMRKQMNDMMPVSQTGLGTHKNMH